MHLVIHSAVPSKSPLPSGCSFIPYIKFQKSDAF